MRFIRKNSVLGLPALVALWGLSACVTDEKVAHSVAPVETHYTLRQGPTERNQRPLPDRTPIYVDAYLSDGSRISRLGFVGWDVNGDGKFEMVEQLADDGSVVDVVYNFPGASVADENPDSALMQYVLRAGSADRDESQAAESENHEEQPVQLR